MRKGFGILLLLVAVVAVGGNWLKHGAQGSVQRDAVIAAPAQAAAGEILLVNRSHPLPEGYAPVELVNLYEQTRHFQLASSDILLERVAFEAAERMFERAEADGVDGFILTSGYRTQEKQRELYQENQDGTAALPGCSEHQTGLAFDVTAYRDGGFETTAQFRWLVENCWDYGFILRYPEDKEDVTGFRYEPWHYRYVGEEAARAMRDANCTLEEYLGAEG